MTKPVLLADENEFFEAKQEELLQKYPNQFLLIHGPELIGAFDSFDAAMEFGVRRFETGPFLIRKPGDKGITLDAPALALGLLAMESE